MHYHEVSIISVGHMLLLNARRYPHKQDIKKLKGIIVLNK